MICLNCKKEAIKGFKKGYCNRCYCLKRYREKRNVPEGMCILEFNRITKKNNGFTPKYKKNQETYKRGKSGSGSLRKDGYRILKINDHPNSMKGGRILEHTFVMSTHLGRALMKNEKVHHKNGVRNDNRIENLELWSTSHPSGQRVEDKIKWAKDFLNNYGYKINDSI